MLYSSRPSDPLRIYGWPTSCFQRNPYFVHFVGNDRIFFPRVDDENTLTPIDHLRMGNVSITAGLYRVP